MLEKDLSVYVDNALSFKEHVIRSTAKANKVVGIIRRTFDFLTDDLLVRLYKSLVRPLLEYGHSVWQPQHKTLCSDVEDVQRRDTKLLASIRDKPYPECLATLRLPSLEFRRKRGDMIDLWKYIHGVYDTDRPHFDIEKTRDTRGNSLKINKHRCRLNLRNNSFSHRVVNDWNSLPESVVTAPTVNCFKNRLDKHWRITPLCTTPTVLLRTIEKARYYMWNIVYATHATN